MNEWTQWREGDNLHESYRSNSGQVVRTTYLGWFSVSQKNARRAFSEQIVAALSPLLKRWLQ